MERPLPSCSAVLLKNMGPRRSYNYGTFIAPPGCCAEETHREVGNGGFQGSAPRGEGSAPAFSSDSITGLEYHILTSGLGLEKHGTCIVISKIGDDAARVGCLIGSSVKFC